MYLRDISTEGIMLFLGATCSDLVFSRTLCFFETKTCNHPFFKHIELTHHSGCNYPFGEWLFFYYKRVVAAMHFSNLLRFFRKGEL